MTDFPERPVDMLENLLSVVTASLFDETSPADIVRLEQLVCNDDRVCELYVQAIFDSLVLRKWSSVDAQDVKIDTSREVHVDRFDDSKPVVAPSPLLPLLSNTLPGMVGFFSSGWPVAYLIATMIFGIGLLIGSLVHVSQPVLLARQSLLPGRVDAEPKTEVVGRITGMVDCKWAGTALDSPGVPVGTKYELASGLMEITYDTGAKVLLQGPVTYEVESATGGYLAVGRLTARVDKKGSGFSGQGSEISNSQDPRPKTQDPRPNPLFSVRTPTATVTDLGTEFGVEVDKQGGTSSHVFRGSVKLQVAADKGETEATTHVLHENESARVERSSGKQSDGNCVILLGPSVKPAGFVREIPKRTARVLDLVDVVAGGDGFSGRRGRGIDPNSGRIFDTFPYDLLRTTPYQSDGQYHRVVGMPFVDGICVPHNGKNGVQIDSAGHVFTEFGVSESATWACLWAGGPLPFSTAEVPTVIDGVDYAVKPHGFLYMDANKLVTFDLDAIRRANPGWKLLRFRAVTANAERQSVWGVTVSADVWVFVDGEIRFRRRDINGYSGAVPAAVSIDEKDRFLTLAATDSGNTIRSDFILFGDPRLELLGRKE